MKDLRTRAALPKLYINIFKLSLSHDKTKKQKGSYQYGEFVVMINHTAPLETKACLVIGICVRTRLTFFDNWEKTATAKPGEGRWSNHHVMALIKKERKRRNSFYNPWKQHVSKPHSDVLLVAICSMTCHRKSLSPFLPPVMHARWRWLLLEREVYSFLNGLLFI